jgi:ferredoxin-NADP reductase
MPDAKLSVVMTGPYGERTMHNLSPDSNILCIAGGTGITYVLPVLLDLASRPQSMDRHMHLVWVIRHRGDLDWVAPELAILKRKCPNLRANISIYVTRASEDTDPSAPAVSGKSNPHPHPHHPRHFRPRSLCTACPRPNLDSAISRRARISRRLCLSL